MEIKDYVKQFRDLQKSHKKVRVADFCRENMLDLLNQIATDMIRKSDVDRLIEEAVAKATAFK